MSKARMLSRNTVTTGTPGGGRHIVCVSGGLSSAWVAWWVKNNIKGEIIYYFNDTKWEHPDLYRFLNDIADTLNIEMYYDNDGRSPEEVFYDEGMLGNNRVPLCSRILKAEMLQRFAKAGDSIYFGIEGREVHRAARISPIYARLECDCRFPIIDNDIQPHEYKALMKALNVEIPQLYKDGFAHNNCGGGCIRAGKRQWLSLLHAYPGVYADRERVEVEFSEEKGRPSHFLKDISLKELREIDENQGVLEFGDDEWQGECIGICGVMA